MGPTTTQEIIASGGFISGVMYDVFWRPSPGSPACNSTILRHMMNAQCGTNFPQVRYEEAVMTNGWLRPVLIGLLIAIVVSVLNRWHWHPAAVFCSSRRP